MKTTVKTIAIASIIALGTASAFARPANGHHNNPQGKTVTTTTVKTTTTTKTVKEQPKKVASNHHARPDAKPAPKKEISHRKEHDNRRRHVAKHEGPKYEPRPVAKQEGPKAPKPECKPAPVAKHVHPKPACRPTTVVKKVEVVKTVPAPVTVVEEVEVRPVHAEVDGASLAAGAIIGGIIGLTIAAAAN